MTTGASTEALAPSDLAIVEKVERSLARGLALRRWWESADVDDGYAERFETVLANKPA